MPANSASSRSASTSSLLPENRAYAGLAVDLLGGDALVLQRRQHARRDGRLDRGRRNAELLRLDRRPFAGALLAGAVEDDVDHRLAGLGIVGVEHLGGDLDQVGIEPALVPFGEDRADLLRRHAEPVAQDAVDLGDHLHVGIFDAVVDRLDEMAGAVGAEPGGAGLALIFGRDRGQHLLDALPRRLGAADHDRRAVPRAFLAARNADADEGQAGAFQFLEAAHRVAEIGVAGIDHDVVGRQHAAQMRDLLVDRARRPAP